MFRHYLPFAMICSLALTAADRGPQPPSDLRCEYMKNPMGVDTAQPRFFWTLRHDARGQKQTAYQIALEPGLGHRQSRLHRVQPHRLQRPGAEVRRNLSLEGPLLG